MSSDEEVAGIYDDLIAQGVDITGLKISDDVAHHMKRLPHGR